MEYHDQDFRLFDQLTSDTEIMKDNERIRSHQ